MSNRNKQESKKTLQIFRAHFIRVKVRNQLFRILVFNLGLLINEVPFLGGRGSTLCETVWKFCDRGRKRSINLVFL